MTIMATTILIVDDSISMRRVLGDAIKQAGWQVDTAFSAAEAIRRARQRPTAILLDCTLGADNGIDVVRALGRDPQTANIPIVAMSANDVRKEFQDIQQVVDILHKPFENQDMLRVLRRHIVESPLAEVKLPEANTQLSKAILQQVAAQIFNIMKPLLGRIPEWHAAWHMQSGRQPQSDPAPFFAGRLLTTPIVSALATTIPAIVQPTHETLLNGSSSCLGILTVIRSLADSGRTGILAIDHGGREAVCIFRRGLLLALGHGANDIDQAPEGISREALERATQAARAIDIRISPILTLVETVGVERVQQVLHEIAERTAGTLLAGGISVYRFLDVPGIERLPSLCQIPLMQLDLIRWRQIDDLAQVEAVVGGLSQILHRCGHFADTIKCIVLDVTERTVLSMIDGNRTIGQVIERSGLPALSILHAVFRLVKTGLITGSPGTAAVKILGCIGCDAYERKDLISSIQRIGCSWRVEDINIGDLETMLVQIVKMSPSAIIHRRGNLPSGLADAVQQRLESTGTVLIGVQDGPERALQDGFIILTCPVLETDLFKACGITLQRVQHN